MKIVLALLLLGTCCFTKAQTKRDAYKHPFSKISFWNMPIGSNAKYEHAHLQPATASGVTIDEDYIVMRPTVSLIPIAESDAGWNWNKDRCKPTGGLLFSAPIPSNFTVSPSTWDGRTPNAGLAVLMPDGKTIKQTQPFAWCNTKDSATSKYNFADEDLYGEGRGGAHGGSGLSAIGGTIRIGELVPGGLIKHALKINLFAKENLSRFAGGFRWPAYRPDTGWEDPNSSNYYNGVVDACRIGSLLAIRPVDYDSIYKKLSTAPAKIVLEALKNYGAYIVDNTAWDVYSIITEWGPDGRVLDEFKNVWGFEFKSNQEHPWYKDIALIHDCLYVVDNNTSDNIGGGGIPLAPLAPDFGRSGNKAPFIQINVENKKNEIIVKANARDEDGRIAKVDFFVNDELFFTAKSAPFQLLCKKNMFKGARIIAKVFDHEGAISFSRAIIVNEH